LLLIKIKVNDANNFWKVAYTSFLGLNKPPCNTFLITLAAQIINADISATSAIEL